MKLINYLSVAGLLVLAVGVLFFGFNVGLTGFLVGSVLLFVDGDSKKAIQSVPWNVIWMVLGVGILMNIVQISGGVDLMVSALQTIITKNTASPIMGILAGVMSLFSSGLGVVFPTLIPTAGGLSTATGANAVSICAAIVIGGTIAGYTPISTAGALIMAGVAQQENAEERFPQNRIFVELFVISFIALALLAVLGFTGVYDIVVNMFA
jgi:di/tricarboxylate transporter